MITSKSSTGSRPLADETSTRCTSTLVRSRWLQEPVAEAVTRVRAFDQPGHVGDDELRSPDRPTTPRLGVSVVNG